VRAVEKPPHKRATRLLAFRKPNLLLASSPGLSKLNSVRSWIVEVDVILGELGVLTDKSIKGPSAYHHVLAVSLERR
jgi:hypothetical protein